MGAAHNAVSGQFPSGGRSTRSASFRCATSHSLTIVFWSGVFRYTSDSDDSDSRPEALTSVPCRPVTCEESSFFAEGLSSPQRRVNDIRRFGYA